MRYLRSSFCRLLSVGLLLTAQTPPPPQEPPVVLKATARLVQISVVAHRHGAPVGDLKKSDFRIFDNGRPQQIRYFSRQENDPAAAARAVPLPPGAYSNRDTATGGSGSAVPLPNSLTAVLLDTSGSEWSDRILAKKAVLKLLAKIKPGDRVAIYAPGPTVLHGFTSDSASLVRALERLRIDPREHVVPEALSDDDRALDDLTRNAGHMVHFSGAAARLHDLGAIAYQMAGVPGRKNIVWVTAGFSMYPPDDVSSYTMVSNALKLINSMGIAIYPVDLRGLIGPFQLNPALSASADTSALQVMTLARTPQLYSHVTETFIMMNMVAQRTGGVAFKNSNDIGGAVRKAMDDAQITYTLSYTPDHNQWDGSFRSIKVSVDRPGVEVRYRSGYLALEKDPNDPQTRTASLMAVADSPLLATELGLRVLAGPALPPGVPNGQVRIVMDSRDLTFRRAASGKWEVDLDLLMLFRDDQGRVVGRRTRSLTVALTDSRHAAVAQQWMAFNSDLPIPKNAFRARVVVQDLGGGGLGSVDIPLGN